MKTPPPASGMRGETTVQTQSLRNLALAGFFALLPGACVAGGLALAPLTAVAGLAGVRPRALRPPAKPSIQLILFIGFVAWAVLSSAWSAYPDHRQALRTV